MTHTQPDPDISVVIPAYNAQETLAAQLDAVCAQDFAGHFEIVVVDNISTDGTADLVRTYAARDPRVRLHQATNGSGPSHARNAGIVAARSELVACCDADDVATPSWLGAMHSALRVNDAVAGVLDVELLNDPVVVAARGATLDHAAGNFMGLTFAHGASFGIRRSVYLESGGFDERLRAGEEIDLAIRLLLRGTRFVECTDAVVHYRYRNDSSDQWRQAFEYGRVKPYISRALRGTPIAAPGRFDGLRNWFWLLRKVPRLRDPVLRMRWRWILASRCGQIAGCIRYRTFYI